MSSTDVYQSTPLPDNSRSVRVLDVKESNRDNDPLIGTLRVISLDYPIENQVPMFNALSYVWGDYASQVTLYCGSNELPITRNCWNALRKLRSLLGGITIWVDAICINQNDDGEKIQQLKLMEDIYTWAEVVYIWLGVGSPAVSSAMDCLYKAAEGNYFPLNRVRAKEDLNERKALRIFSRQAILPYGFLHLIWSGSKLKDLKERTLYINMDFFTEFFNQEWFLRAWTFQEALLPSHSVILSGSSVLRWDTFVKGMECLRFLFPEQLYQEIGEDPILHYGQLIGSQRVIAPDDAIFTFRQRIHLPKAFYAFDRIIHIWSRIDRPILRDPEQEGNNALPKQSAQNLRKAFTDSHAHFLPSNFCGFVDIRVAFFILSLFSYMVIVHAIFLKFLPLEVVVVVVDLMTFLPIMSELSVSIGFIDESLKFRNFLSSGDDDMGSATGLLLEGIVQTLRQRHAKLPKDLSFSLYGILKRLGLQPAEPDYRKSQGQVYYELMLDLLHWSPASVILLLDAGPVKTGADEMSDAPSWVPDWSRLPPEPTISTNYFSIVSRKMTELPLMSSPFFESRRTMDVTPTSSPFFELDTSYRKLCVLGHWKGFVLRRTPSFPRIERDTIGYRAWMDVLISVDGPLAIFAEWVYIVQSTPRPLQPISSYRPMVDDYDPSAEPGERHEDVSSDDIDSSPITEPRKFLDIIDIFLVINRSMSVGKYHSGLGKMISIVRIIQKESPYPLGCIPPRLLHRMVLELIQDVKVFFYFIDLIENLASNDRRLFVTSEGFLGCASNDMAEGDRIALVSGIPAPLILRPVDTDAADWFSTSYKTVCSTFILGWMDGSAFQPNNLERIIIV